MVFSRRARLKPIAPCLDCSEREFKCHSKCQKYIDYKNAMQIEWDLKAKAKEEESIYLKGKVRKR